MIVIRSILFFISIIFFSLKGITIVSATNQGTAWFTWGGGGTPFTSSVVLPGEDGPIHVLPFSCPEQLNPSTGSHVFLFFSLSNITDQAVTWERFFSETVAPRFSERLMALDVSGQRINPGTGDTGHSVEPVKLLVIDVTPHITGEAAHTKDPMQLVNEISREIEVQFGQKPVFRMSNAVCY